MAYKQLKLWFDKELAESLSDKILSIDHTFDKSEFVKRASQGLDSMELKDRVEHFADQLYFALYQDYEKCVNTLVGILGPENENEEGMFKTYYWIMPIAKLVEKYGLEHFELSMKAIAEITKRNTGEYAIRPYLVDNHSRTLKQIQLWSNDENKHVRRLASEGIRPRLPWAKKLDIFIDDPKPILPILTTLNNDKSKYVQKSVANCLNDILKDNTDIGKELIEKWMSKPISAETKWIIKHSIRNLLKKEDNWAIDIKSRIT